MMVPSLPLAVRSMAVVPLPSSNVQYPARSVSTDGSRNEFLFSWISDWLRARPQMRTSSIKPTKGLMAPPLKEPIVSSCPLLAPPPAVRVVTTEPARVPST